MANGIVDWDYSGKSYTSLLPHVLKHKVVFTYYDGYAKYDYITRQPAEMLSYDQHFKTFSNNVWFALIATLALLSFIFRVMHWIYDHQISPQYSLAGSVTHPLDFVILTLSSLTEPDPLPWFPRASAGEYANFEVSLMQIVLIFLGRTLVLIWSFFCMNMIFFYSCNLRSEMIKVKYEKGINTAEDVIKSGKPIMIRDITYSLDLAVA